MKSQQTEAQVEFRPNPTSFIWLTLIRRAVSAGFSVLISGILAVAVQDTFLVIFAVLGLVTGVVVLVFGVIDLFFRYRKELYTLTNTHVIRRSGGIFSDQEVKVAFKRITSVKRIYPFLDRQLVGTGDISLESAGSRISEIEIRGVEQIDKLFTEIIDRTQANGVEVDLNTEVYQTRPAVIGVLIKVGSYLVSGGFFIVFFGFGALNEFLTSASELGSGREVILGLGFLALLGVLVLGSVSTAIAFYEYRLRTYTLTPGAAIFDGGFLTKVYSVLPLQNFSDSNSTQGLLQQLVGIYDVKLSARGSGTETSLTDVRDGKKFESILNEAIASKRSSLQTEVVGEIRGEIASENGENVSLGKPPGESADSRNRTEGRDVPITNAELNLKLNVFRQVISAGIATWLVFVLGGLIALIVIPDLALGIGVFLGAIMLAVLATGFSILSSAIEYFANDYTFGRDQVSSRYRFIGSNTLRFGYSQVSYIELRQNPIDLLFKTATIRFVSVGTIQTLVFKSVNYTPQVRELLDSKFNFDDANATRVYRPFLSISNFFWGNLSVFAWLAVVTILLLVLSISLLLSEPQIGLALSGGIVVMLVLVFTTLGYLYFDLKTFRLSHYKEYFELTGGLWRRVRKLTPTEFVKDVETRSYPVANSGDLKLNVAGEVITTTSTQSGSQGEVAIGGQNARSSSAAFAGAAFNSLNLELRYLNQAQVEGRELIGELEQIPTPEQSQPPLRTAKVNLLAEGLFPVLVGFVILPTLPFELYRLLRYASKRFHFYESEVVLSWGVVYKTEFRLAYSNIDFILRSQGPIQKLFGVEAIRVHTIGGGGVELNIDNISSREIAGIYELLEAKT